MKILAVAGLGLVLATAQTPVPGALGSSMTRFEDSAMGVNYEYPAAFRSNPETAAAILKGFADGAAADPDHAAEAKCMAVPLVAIKGTGAPNGGEFGMIVIMKADYRCAGQEGGEKYLGEDAQRLMRILDRFGRSSTDDALRYKLAGHPAAFVKGSAPAKMLGDGSMVHAASVCTLVGKATLCWIILDTDHKVMPGLVGTPVTFDGITEPLVSKDFVSAW